LVTGQSSQEGFFGLGGWGRAGVVLAAGVATTAAYTFRDALGARAQMATASSTLSSSEQELFRALELVSIRSLGAARLQEFRGMLDNLVKSTFEQRVQVIFSIFFKYGIPSNLTEEVVSEMVDNLIEQLLRVYEEDVRLSMRVSVNRLPNISPANKTKIATSLSTLMSNNATFLAKYNTYKEELEKANAGVSKSIKDMGNMAAAAASFAGAQGTALLQRAGRGGAAGGGAAGGAGLGRL
jgi:uncharacterized protein YejL (UPF0352 family)